MQQTIGHKLSMLSSISPQNTTVYQSHGQTTKDPIQAPEITTEYSADSR